LDKSQDTENLMSIDLNEDSRFYFITKMGKCKANLLRKELMLDSVN